MLTLPLASQAPFEGPFLTDPGELVPKTEAPLKRR
jgi:hypothetical protein